MKKTLFFVLLAMTLTGTACTTTARRPANSVNPATSDKGTSSGVNLFQDKAADSRK